MQGLSSADPVGYRARKNQVRGKQEADEDRSKPIPYSKCQHGGDRGGKTKVLTSERVKGSRSVDPKV
jgi:hypothetical protein